MKWLVGVIFGIAVPVLAGLAVHGQPSLNTGAVQQVQGVAQNVSTVNASVTITAGGTFQTVLPSILGTSTRRQALTIQNNNSISTGTEYCYLHIGTGTPTTANSIILGPGGSYQRYFPYVPSDAFQATCTTETDTLYIDYQ